MDTFDCDKVLEGLSEYIDSDARDELCQEIAKHLSSCRDCSVKVDTVKKTIVLYQSNGGTSSFEMPMRATAGLTEALAREYGTSR